MRTRNKHAVISTFIALVLLLLSTGAALADSQTYVVQPGDTIFKISVRFGVSMDAIRAANGISGNLIYSGQTLIIPDPNGSGCTSCRAVRPSLPSVCATT